MTPTTQAGKDLLTIASLILFGTSNRHHAAGSIIAIEQEATADLRAENATLRAALAEAHFGAHQLARHVGHPKDCAHPQCARWVVLGLLPREPEGGK